jgi:hypothetical protein
VFGCSTKRSEPNGNVRTEVLEQQVERQRKPCDEPVSGYFPKATGIIDDLNDAAAEIPRRLPDVAEVEQLLAPPKPEHRIIHLRDRHYVPPDLFALDERQGPGKALSDEQVDALYPEHLLEVEMVQLEHATILRCLIQHHGLRPVLAEGMTANGLPNYL